MPNSPSGRVAVYQEWNGTRITIRAARGWMLLFCVLWLSIWLTAPMQIVLATVRGLSHPNLTHPGSAEPFSFLWTIGWFFGSCFVLWQILWSFGGMETLLLTPSELEITSTLFGITMRRKRALTSEIRNLRFTPAYRRGRGQTPSRIAFEYAQGTTRFASGIKDSDAITVIDAMLAIYPFPKQDPALAYMGAASIR